MLDIKMQVTAWVSTGPLSSEQLGNHLKARRNSWKSLDSIIRHHHITATQRTDPQLTLNSILEAGRNKGQNSAVIPRGSESLEEQLPTAMPGPRPPGDNADSSSLSRPGEQTAARKNMTVFLAYPQLEVSNQLFLNKLLNYRKEMTHSFSPVLYRSYANNLSHYLQIEHAYVILR